MDPNIPDEIANSIRPKTLDDFIGHESLKQNLSVFVSAARSRGEAMDHVLLYGPPGLGKTTLAHIVANELGTNFRATSAPMLTKQGDLAAILTVFSEKSSNLLELLTSITAPKTSPLTIIGDIA